MPDYKPNITPPECKPLTLDVAMEYLRLNTWTTREAVLILNLIDPRSNILNDVDFDHDYDEWDVNIETYELAARRFNKASKPLPVEQWLTWAIKGTEEEPRRQPLSYAEKMLEAKLTNEPELLRGISKAIDRGFEVIKGKKNRGLVKKKSALDPSDNERKALVAKEILRPDWDHWSTLYKVNLREAVLLSLDVDPPSASFKEYDSSPPEMLVPEAMSELKSEYTKRVRSVISHQGTYPGAPVRVVTTAVTIHDSTPRSPEKFVDVALPDIAQLARKLKWNVPKQFEELSPEANVNNENQNNELGGTAIASLQVAQQKRQKKASDKQVQSAFRRIEKDGITETQAAQEIGISQQAMKNRFKTLGLSLSRRK